VHNDVIVSISFLVQYSIVLIFWIVRKNRQTNGHDDNIIYHLCALNVCVGLLLLHLLIRVFHLLSRVHQHLSIIHHHTTAINVHHPTARNCCATSSSSCSTFCITTETKTETTVHNERHGQTTDAAAANWAGTAGRQTSESEMSTGYSLWADNNKVCPVNWRWHWGPAGTTGRVAHRVDVVTAISDVHREMVFRFRRTDMSGVL